MNRLTVAFMLLATFFAGCIAAHYVIPAARAGTSPQRYEYLCDNIGFGGMDQFKAIAKEAGEKGWELVGVFGANGTGYCFKRAL